MAQRNREINTDVLFQKIKEVGIDLCDGSGTESLELSLAKTLADVMSFIIADDNSEARQKALNTINELYDTLRNLKGERQRLNLAEESDEQEKLDGQLDNLSAKITSFVAHLNTQTNLNFDQFISIENRFLEDDSYLMLKTVHRVLNLFNNRGFNGFPPDYTPGVICLAKVFEKEINLSVVHWIRKNLRIRLPLYFNRYDPKKGNVGLDGVNFNRSHDNKIWSPPSIGRSLEVCKQINEPGNMPDELVQNWCKLLEVWDVIKNERNRAAHAVDLVNKDSVQKVRKALGKLSSNGIFEKLYNMKTQYRGP